MVWARTTARRGWLCQADLGGKRRWKTEQRKTETEMDRRRQAQHGGPAAQRGGCRESSWMEKENPCGWSLTWGIHSLKEREAIFELNASIGYLVNGSRYVQSYYEWQVIGSCIICNFLLVINSNFDWHQDRWPWIFICHKFLCWGPSFTHVRSP